MRYYLLYGYYLCVTPYLLTTSISICIHVYPPNDLKTFNNLCTDWFEVDEKRENLLNWYGQSPRFKFFVSSPDSL